MWKDLRNGQKIATAPAEAALGVVKLWKDLRNGQKIATEPLGGTREQPNEWKDLRNGQKIATARRGLDDEATPPVERPAQRSEDCDSIQLTP